MPRAVIDALGLTAGWSLPAVLAYTQVVLTHAMWATINWTYWIEADIGSSLSWRETPTSRAKAFTLDAHTMLGAIKRVQLLIPVSAMLILAMFSEE